MFGVEFVVLEWFQARVLRTWDENNSLVIMNISSNLTFQTAPSLSKRQILWEKPIKHGISCEIFQYSILQVGLILTVDHTCACVPILTKKNRIVDILKNRIIKFHAVSGEELSERKGRTKIDVSEKMSNIMDEHQYMAVACAAKIKRQSR